MPTFPADMWHEVSDRPEPRDLSSLLMTHRRAKDVVDRHQIENIELWDSVFEDNNWTEEAISCGLMPILIRQYREKPYIYLMLEKSDEGKAVEKTTLSDTLRKSLRSQKAGKNICEIDFQAFTLNISHIMWPTFILLKDFRWFPKGEEIQVAIHGGRIHQVKIETAGDFAFIEIPEHGVATFWKNTDLSIEYYPGYAESYT